jgi:hypothetical protein
VGTPLGIAKGERLNPVGEERQVVDGPIVMEEVQVFSSIRVGDEAGLVRVFAALRPEDRRVVIRSVSLADDDGAVANLQERGVLGFDDGGQQGAGEIAGSQAIGVGENREILLQLSKPAVDPSRVEVVENETSPVERGDLVA